MAKYYYNGVLLPEIPADVLAEYPYCWIRENTDGTYEFVFSTSQWFINASDVVELVTLGMYSRYTTSADGETLNHHNTYTDQGLMSQANGLIWTNKDILDGSATSTTVFLKATSAIPENQESKAFYKISKHTLTSIADQARRLDGGTTTLLTPSQMLEIFEGVEQGSEGIEGGYDVTFYDENGEELAFYSVKQGHSIDAPNYSATSWLTEDDVAVSFPYFPTGDISLYANSDTYAGQLYRFYGISSDEYPYLYIEYNKNNGGWLIFFGKTMENNWIYDVRYKTPYYGGAVDDMSDIESVFDKVTGGIDAVSLTGTSTRIDDYDYHTYYTNFDYTFENSTLYRLDETESSKVKMSNIVVVNDFEVNPATHPTIEMSGTTNTICNDATNMIIGVTTYEEVL